MGKAFSEEEKEQIKIKIMEEGLKLFHENGNKALSIRELTDRVGISQGGFYSFFESKEDLVLAIVKYRSLQKMDFVAKNFEQSLQDPVGYLTAVVYKYFIDIAHKVQQKRMYSDMIHLVLMRTEDDEIRNCEGGAGCKGGAGSGGDEVFKEYLFKMKEFWEAHGKKVEMDMEGLWCMVSTICVLLDNRKICKESYMDDMLKMIIEGTIKKYLIVK